MSIAWQTEREVAANCENAYLSDLPVTHRDSVKGAGLAELMTRSSPPPIPFLTSYTPLSLAGKDAGVLWEKSNKTVRDHAIKGCTIQHRHKGEELMLYGKSPDLYFLTALCSPSVPLA